MINSTQPPRCPLHTPDNHHTTPVLQSQQSSFMPRLLTVVESHLATPNLITSVEIISRKGHVPRKTLSDAVCSRPSFLSFAVVEACKCISCHPSVQPRP